MARVDQRTFQTTPRRLPDPTTAEIEQMRQEMLGLQKSADPKAASKASRMLQWIDIVSARTVTERHDRIRRLPVTIVRSAPDDGRAGVVKSFVAGGKTRVRLFVPAVSEQRSHAPAGLEHPSGPAAEEECYGGEPAPCATDQDVEDLLIATSSLEAEIEYRQGEYDTVTAELRDYCDSNPWDCDLPASGPSAGTNAFFGCAGEAANAVFALGGAALAAGATYAAVSDAAVAGAALSVATTAVLYGGIALGFGALGYYGYQYWACKRASTGRLNSSLWVPNLYEPAY